MQFYLAARGATPLPPANIWGCPGEAFFVKNRLGAQARVMSAPGDARCRLKLPLGRPRSPKREPISSNGALGEPFGRLFVTF